MSRPIAVLVACAFLGAAPAAAFAKGEENLSSEDRATSRDYLGEYRHVRADYAPDQNLHMHISVEFGPYSMVSLNTHTNLYLHRILNVTADLGIGFGTGPGGDRDKLSWMPNPWGAVSVGYPILGRTHHGGGRWVISQDYLGTEYSGGNTYEIYNIRYFDIELPVQRRFTIEATAIHGTPHFDFDNRATAFGAGIRYQPVWSSLMHINQEGGYYYEAVIEHTWYLAAHVLFAQIGPSADADTDLPVGFMTTFAHPVRNDRDNDMNLIWGLGAFPEGGLVLRFGLEGAFPLD